jgi:hypothetical protein
MPTLGRDRKLAGSRSGDTEAVQQFNINGARWTRLLVMKRG